MSKANRDNGERGRSSGERPRRQRPTGALRPEMSCEVVSPESVQKDGTPSDMIMVCTGHPLLTPPRFQHDHADTQWKMMWSSSKAESARVQEIERHADAVSMSTAVVKMLAQVANTDSSEDVRRAALLALERIGLEAAHALTTVVSALTETQRCLAHNEVRTCSEFALDRIRDIVAQSANVPRTRLRVAPRCGPADSVRRDDEPAKGVLALLNALLNWEGESISRRKLPESTRLMEERQALGLRAEVSASTVGYQLALLSKLCGEISILETYNKRQCARLRPGIKDKLATIHKQLAPHILAGSAGDPLPALRLRFNKQP